MQLRCTNNARQIHARRRFRASRDTRGELTSAPFSLCERVYVRVYWRARASVCVCTVGRNARVQTKNCKLTEIRWRSARDEDRTDRLSKARSIERPSERASSSSGTITKHSHHRTVGKYQHTVPRVCVLMTKSALGVRARVWRAQHVVSGHESRRRVVLSLCATGASHTLYVSLYLIRWPRCGFYNTHGCICMCVGSSRKYDGVVHAVRQESSALRVRQQS